MIKKRLYSIFKSGVTTVRGTELDLEAIAKECNLIGCSDDANIGDIIGKIVSLEETYERENLVKIYNFFLTVCRTPEILAEIIRCEDKYRDKSSLSPLLDILLWKMGDDSLDRDKYISVRVMCARAIANLKDTSAVTPLLYCLNNKHENYKVRFACADALGKIGDKYAVAPLIEVVKDEDESSVYLRESAASALGMLGDLRAIDPLVSILETKQGLVGKFTFLKERVIEALGKMRLEKNKRVFNALKSSLSDGSAQVRINAIEALMESDFDEAYSVIKRCLIDDEDNEVKKNALIALYNMRGREILDEVIHETSYCDILKIEAVSIIEEYETEDDEISEKIREELDD